MEKRTCQKPVHRETGYTEIETYLVGGVEVLVMNEEQS